MPRNTFLLISSLAVIAALVVGVNIGKQFSKPQVLLPTPTPIVSPTPTLIPPTTFSSKQCGISFDYPANFTKQEATDSSGVIFSDSGDAKTMIILVCQKDIPRVPLPPEKIETMQIASISAKLYHDKSLKDGTLIDKLIFYNPKVKLDVFFAGLGNAFDAAVASLKTL